MWHHGMGVVIILAGNVEVLLAPLAFVCDMVINLGYEQSSNISDGC